MGVEVENEEYPPLGLGYSHPGHPIEDAHGQGEWPPLSTLITA